MNTARKRAAHFLLTRELAYSPPNEAIISILLSLGYAVDIFAPGGEFSVSEYGPDARSLPVEYGRKWLLKHVFSSRWSKYDLFSGTSEEPMGVVGVLAAVYRKRSFCLADEIRSGSYYGNIPEYWKKLCRWGMRSSAFNIVNDEARVELLKEYAKLPDRSDIIVYPGCFRVPPDPVDSHVQRARWRIPDEAFIIAHSGWLNYMTGADWVFKGVKGYPDIFGVLQPMSLQVVEHYLIENFIDGDRLFVEKGRLGWRESWATMSAVDVGLVVYRNTGPQFQNMGMSSNKLCMFLAMGVPVIALKQKSFDFLEDYECGVLVETEAQFLDAIERVRTNLSAMKQNALRCSAEYINASGRYEELKSHLASLT